MLPDEVTAKKLAALAHPARIAIMRILVRSGPAGLPAGKLGETLDIGASALTFHLQKLAQVDLVSSERRGQFIVYSTEFSNLLNLVDELVGSCCADSLEKCDPECPSIEIGPKSTMYTSADQLNERKRSLK